MTYFSNNTRLAIVTCLVVVGLMALTRSPAQAQICEVDLGYLITQCTKYVQKDGPKIPPSTTCCSVMKDLDVPCACQHIPKETEDVFSMEKVVYCVRYCGGKAKAGTKCGSYTIPPPIA